MKGLGVKEWRWGYLSGKFLKWGGVREIIFSGTRVTNRQGQEGLRERTGGRTIREDC